MKVYAVREQSVSARRSLRSGTAVCLLLMLAGCGGSSGGPISTPPPQPAPAPVPAPAPAPAPAPSTTLSSTFNTAEYRRSDGPGQHKAYVAWQSGIDGTGSTIAIIDTGIDTDSPEFAGRILAASQDVAGNGTIEAQDDHGTNVALVAAAARNGSGVMGIAYNANLLVLRSDTPGSCGISTPENTNDSCTFSDTNIAKGIDAAVSAGAKVINLSLGGDGVGKVVLDAVRRASAAGIAIVVSAGNGGDGSDAGTDPNQPDAFASGIRTAGGNNVIIVGSVNASNAMSNFSQRAGTQADWYLAARGEDVCCIYQNGQIYTGQGSNGPYNLVISGTSFSAPQVAGAIALLAQAFPNLTGQQIVEILLSTADDLGATGTDAVYGRGLLDIAAAFQPQGATTLAGSTSVVNLASQSAIASSAMGDALSGGQSVQAVVLDKYKRAYEVDLGTATRGAALQPKLASAIGQGQRVLTGGNAAMSLAFTVADPQADGANRWAGQLRLSGEDAENARVLAARIAARLSPRLDIAFALREGADGLTAQLQDADRPAFLIARGAQGDTGFVQTNQTSFALRRRFGQTGITVSAERGEAWLGNRNEIGQLLRGSSNAYPTQSFSVTADRRIGGLQTSLGLTRLSEDRTVLGGLLGEEFGAGGADSFFLDASVIVPLGEEWQLGGAWRQGYTHARIGGTIADGSQFASNAWSVDLSRRSFFTRGDGFGLRLSQPLRVASGGLRFYLPVGYDYASEQAQYGLRSLSLAPSGREIDGEMAWWGPLLGGTGRASLYIRKEPGHYASLPTDHGIALSWQTNF